MGHDPKMSNLLIEISWIMKRVMTSAGSREEENLGFVSKTGFMLKRDSKLENKKIPICILCFFRSKNILTDSLR